MNDKMKKLSDINRLYHNLKQSDSETSPHSCNCVGPQNGEPACPCKMKHVSIVDGKYVLTTVLGDVK